MRNNETGRSMVEMLGVLAIIGVLSAGGLAGYSKAMFKHKLNTTMDQITMLVTNIRTVYGQKGNYGDLKNEKVSQLGILKSFTNPFKGDITVLKAGAKSGDTNTAFTVQYTGLPAEACIALATADFGSGAGSGFIGVEVNGNASSLVVGGKKAVDPVYESDGKTVKTPGSAAVAEGAVYSMANAIAACKDSQTNYITWKFY